MKNILIILFIMTSLFSSNNILIDFTAEEKQWLQNNPDIKLAIIATQEPLTITKNNEMIGIVPDYIDFINQKINQKIKLVGYPDGKSVLDATSLEGIYGTATVFKNDAFKNKFNFTNSYMETSVNFFVNKVQENKIKNEKDLNGKTLSILKNHVRLLDYVKGIEGVKVVYATSIKEQFEMLQYNKVDALIGYVNYHYLLTKMLFDKVTFAFSAKNNLAVVMGININHPILTNILNKAIVELSETKKQEVLKKWLTTSKSDVHDYLTFDEKNWLNQNHTVNVRVGSWPPFQMNKNDKFEGISVDYIKTIFDKYNINYKFISAKNIPWKKSLELIADKKKIDLLLTAKQTPDRAKKMLFTDNYLSPPLVIFTKDDYEFISKVEDLNGKTVAVQEGFVIEKTLVSEFPNINILSVKGSNATEEAIKLVSSGEVDAFIGNLASGTYIVKELFLDNVKVAAPTNFENHENAMAVRNDWAPLVSIINKELKHIKNTNTNEDIYNKYLSMKYEYGISITDVIQWITIIIVVFVLIIISISIYNRRLIDEIKKRKKLEKEAKKYIKTIKELSITDPLTELYNRRHFQEIIKKEVNIVKRKNTYLSFLMIDIDYFKNYNDVYGHQSGDNTLIKVAKVLKSNVQRADDYSFRLGGEEFGILFIGLDKKESLLFAEKIRNEIELLHILHKENTASKFLTASFGLVCYKGNDISTIESIYKEADDLLYKAKENGRNKVVPN